METREGMGWFKVGGLRMGNDRQSTNEDDRLCHLGGRSRALAKKKIRVKRSIEAGGNEDCLREDWYKFWCTKVSFREILYKFMLELKIRGSHTHTDNIILDIVPCGRDVGSGAAAANGMALASSS